MENTLHPQFITDEKGNRVSVVLSMKEYEDILEVLEEMEDIRLYDEVKARDEETIPFEDYLKLRQSKK